MGSASLLASQVERSSGQIDKIIAEITAIKWQNLELLNPRSLGDDQGVGIKSVTYANWMRSLDDDTYTSYTKLLNNRKDITCIARLRSGRRL